MSSCCDLTTETVLNQSPECSNFRAQSALISHSGCDELRTKLTDLQTELNDIKKKLEESSQKALEEIPLDIHTEVAGLDESKKWKKRALEKYSFVDNICDLLDELYYYLYEDQDKKKEIRAIIGKKGTNKWIRFQVSVIKYLKDEGSIEDEDYDDTANGCDEIVQDAAFDVLNKMLSVNKSV